MLSYYGANIEKELLQFFLNNQTFELCLALWSSYPLYLMFSAVLMPIIFVVRVKVNGMRLTG